MTHELEPMEQPNGSTVHITVYGESCSCLSDEDCERLGERNSFIGDVHITWGWDSYHCPHEIHNKKFYTDKLGIYTYKKQKTPIYYWEPQNIEEDYDGWIKDAKGYHIPLNQPRKLKKNYFR